MGKIIIKKKRCPKCKGKGVTFDLLTCFATAGVAFIIGSLDDDYKDTCPMCKGSGYITEEFINEYD